MKSRALGGHRAGHPGGGPLALVLLLLAACAGSARREAGSLTDAVDQYRRADSATRAAREAAVASVPCSVARVCAAKDACLAAIGPTTRALSLEDEVAARVHELETGALSKDSPDALALPGKLAEAQRLLVQGRDGMRACDAALGALRADLGT